MLQQLNQLCEQHPLVMSALFAAIIALVVFGFVAVDAAETDEEFQ